MDHNKTPLLTALMEHAAKNPLPFHIPAHKKGKGMDPIFRDLMGERALSIDLINIVPLDDLHQPKGVIKEAEQLAADAFGADYTLFSVQGTTSAIMAMIMSVCGPGDKIIIPRNAHKSILSAIIFAGAYPILLLPEKDNDFGIEHGVTLASIQEALEKHYDAKAILLINPTYYGTSTDLRKMVELIHRYNKPVLVDEAHGTLIHFHEGLPVSAMEAGADMAATSVHKLGGSLTQSSVLNVKGTRIDINRVRAVMSMLMTTSTSYLLLASLDAARRHLMLNGWELAEKTIQLANYARKKINEIPGLFCYGSEIVGSRGIFDYDPTKLCINVRSLGKTGVEAEQWLRQHFNIEVELSDLHNILCFITLADSETEIELLLSALRKMSQEMQDSLSNKQLPITDLPNASSFIVSPRDAFYAETEKVFLREAIGRVVTEFLYVYPPGIPILIPGQMISRAIVDYILQHVEAGLPVKGPEDPSIQTIKVIANTIPKLAYNGSNYLIPD